MLSEPEPIVYPLRTERMKLIKISLCLGLAQVLVVQDLVRSRLTMSSDGRDSLAADESAMMTSHTFTVDGGLSG